MEQCFWILFFAFILDYGICEQKILNSKTQDTNPSNGLTIPIVVYFDRALPITLLTESKNPDRLKTITRLILEDVENIFQRPSLNQTIHFDLIDVKILNNDTNRGIMDANVSRYLKSFCQSEGGGKISREQWYYSVLITGLDLFYLNNDRQPVMSSTGRSYYRGLCSKNHSCVILEWQPKDMGFFLAHEIAHSLGINHDGAPFNECKDRWYIMDWQYNPHNPVRSWSLCNKRDLKQFLESKYARCL